MDINMMKVIYTTTKVMFIGNLINLLQERLQRICGKPIQKTKKIVLATGGFDPLHSGHIEYFKSAKKLGDILVIGVNSDEWLTRKKGQPFLNLSERKTIIENLSMVDKVITFDDSDNSSLDAIYKVKQLYGYGNTIIFVNGGDRTDKNIPEMTPQLLDDVFVEFVFGVGGEDKKNSSSWILKNWKDNKTERTWGHYTVLHDQPNYKVKMLIVEPHKQLSMQRHQHRSEHWYVLEGKCDILTEYNNDIIKLTKNQNDNYYIGKHVWHQCQNNYDEPCIILEVQFGEKCIEEDIERKYE